MRFITYDTETSGVDTAHDQILQMAAVEYDENFNELSNINLRSRRLAHIIPHPKALAVTGIDPFTLDDKALPTPYEFARAVHEQFEAWAPCVFLGYNSLSFDEEIMRSMFWQNLLPPYLTSMNGCKRIDLYPVVQAVASLAPGVLIIPLNSEGKPSYRLENLAPANGYGEFAAHDALADVRATGFIAKLIMTKVPELWALLTGLGDPKIAMNALRKDKARLFTHFGKPEWRMVAPLAANPENPKQYASLDLAYDPAPYLALSSQELADRFSTDYKILRVIKANGQPVLLDASDERGALTDSEDMVAPSIETVEAHLAQIKASDGFIERVKEALVIRIKSFEGKPWLENRIYDGFPTRDDENLAKRFTSAKGWRARLAMAKDFKDERYKTIAHRIACLNVPDEVFESKRREYLSPLLKSRFQVSEDKLPWTTLAMAREGLKDIEGHPMVEQIAKWLDKVEGEMKAQIV